MKIFISGASGLVGGNCLKHFKNIGWEAMGSHRTFPTKETVYFDTLNLESAENFDIKAFQPQAIIHCGALTHVDYCETNEAESFEKNVVATEKLLNIAHEINAQFIFLSTDYIFDGKNGPYKENDTPHPLNIYGKHKLEAEKRILAKSDNHLILRVTNVYGDEIRNKNFIARILKQIENKEAISLKLPYDQFANPTNALDIARAIAELLKAKKKGVYHIAGTDYMNRVSLALKVLSYFPETTYELSTFATSTLKQPALRPLVGGFVTSKFLSEFPDFLFTSVDNYLNEYKNRKP